LRTYTCPGNVAGEKMKPDFSKEKSGFFVSKKGGMEG
jgi:hypothetical protein